MSDHYWSYSIIYALKNLAFKCLNAVNLDYAEYQPGPSTFRKTKKHLLP